MLPSQDMEPMCFLVYFVQLFFAWSFFSVPETNGRRSGRWVTSLETGAAKLKRLGEKQLKIISCSKGVYSARGKPQCLIPARPVPNLASFWLIGWCRETEAFS
jgi:hypothetical protein